MLRTFVQESTRRPEAKAAARAAEARNKARAREVESRPQAFLAAPTPDERTALEAKALAGAAPAARAAYAAAAAPVRRLLLVGLRDALIRHRLGLPAAD